MKKYHVESSEFRSRFIENRFHCTYFHIFSQI